MNHEVATVEPAATATTALNHHKFVGFLEE